jgi:hypothetical protein
VDVAEQEVLQALIQKELKPDGPAIGERDDKAREAAASSTNLDLPKAGPIDLGLLAWEGLKSQEGFSALRAQPSNHSSQRVYAALVAALSQHLKQPRCPQAWILLQSLLDEVEKRIG